MEAWTDSRWSSTSTGLSRGAEAGMSATGKVTGMRGCNPGAGTDLASPPAMLVLLSTLALAAPFDPARVTAIPWAAVPAGLPGTETATSAGTTFTFATQVLAPLGALVPVVGDPTGDGSELRAWRVHFDGERTILGVG